MRGLLKTELMKYLILYNTKAIQLGIDLKNSAGNQKTYK
jgi:hypothetical protein